MSEPRAGWMTRNWKWFVPTGCLTIGLLFALFVGSIFYMVTSMMKGSGAYTQALEIARANPEVIAALGTPIEEGRFVTGSIRESGPGGSAELAIPLSGPKGTGTLYVEAKKSAGEWRLLTLVFEAPDDSRIDLLAAGDDVPDGSIDVEADVPRG